MVLRFKSVVKDCIFNYIILIILPVFLPVFLLGLLPTSLYICLARNLAFLFSGSLSNSFLVKLVNVRINAFCKSLSLLNAWLLPLCASFGR